MIQSAPTKNLPEQFSLPFPEITCPKCSGQMEFHSHSPQEILPSCTTLICKSCYSKEEIFFEQSHTPTYVNSIFEDESNICPLCHQLILKTK